MCGITGCVGPDDSADVVHAGLKNLEYRGYDSAGVALADDALAVHKAAGEVADLELPKLADAPAAIGHTRWSTHGPPTDANAHPHTDCTGSIAVVHNGIIENHAALREDLAATHVFESETDTEVVPHLLEEALAAGVGLPTAVRQVTEQLAGSYAIVVAAAGHEGLVGAREDSPLVVGHGEGANYIASDVTAFVEHTREVTYLENGDLVHLTADGVDIYHDGRPVDRPRDTVDWDAEAAEKGGYPHYMLKEIHEQPAALRQALAGRVDELAGDVGLELAIDDAALAGLHEIQVVACGTSYHAGLYAKELLETHADLRVDVRLGSEYAFRGGRDPEHTLVLAVTQSGETADTLAALRNAAASGARTLALTNTVGSTAAREADDAVFIRAGPEIGVAATKTFVSQVTTLALLALRLGRVRGVHSSGETADRLDAVRALPGAVQQVLDDEAAIADLARTYADSDAFFFIGRGAGHPVALEGALKLKEIAYDHAEGFAAGELKHGPLALVSEDTPVLAVLTAGAAPQRTLTNAQEAATRGAPVVAIASDPDLAAAGDAAVEVPAIGFLEPLLANVAMQLFAYHVADAKGRPIDKPRNLAKSVTVE